MAVRAGLLSVRYIHLNSQFVRSIMQFQGISKADPRNWSLFSPAGTLLTARFLSKNVDKDAQMEQLLSDPRRHFDYDELLTKKNEGELLVIDVRQPEELAATGNIPGSINIPLAELENALTKMPNHEFLLKYGIVKPSESALIVFSCQAGRRSLSALKTAVSNGYLNAGNYKGGWLDWASKTQA